MLLFFSSTSRRRLPSLLRPLSTTTTTTTTTTATATATTTTATSAKAKLHKIFDPDEAISILSTFDPTSSSSRFAVDIAVRRLARSRRYSDIHSLLQSRLHSLPPSQLQNETLISTLILTYATANMISHARQLFDEIPQPTSTSFNALLSAHIRTRKPTLVPNLFTHLTQTHPSIVPDAVSYGILIKSFCAAGNVEKAVEVFNEMKGKGWEGNLIIYTTLIDCFYKKGRRGEAERLWGEMVGGGLEPDLAAYNVKVMGSAMSGKPEDVMEVMKEVEGVGLRPDAITYNYLITCYCRNGRVEEAKEVYRGFFKKNIAANAAMFKMFVTVLCRQGDFDGGLEVFRDSVKHNKIPDFQTLKELVEGLVEGGKEEEAKEVIREVKERFPKDLLRKWEKLETKLGLV